MLKGSLACVSLAGLLQLLCSEKRTGRVDVRWGGGARAGRGSAWMDAGRLVHAEADAPGEGGARRTLAGEEALYELVGHEEGEFGFEPAATAPRRTVRASTEHVLIEAACLRDRRGAGEAGQAEVAEEDVPTFAPVPEDVATPRFNTLQWRLLSCVDGRKDVAALCKDTGLSVQAVRGMVTDLVRVGVLRLA